MMSNKGSESLDPGQRTLADVVVQRIAQAYSRKEARRDGIKFWPSPLPTPVPTLMPDPLILFHETSVTDPNSSMIFKSLEHESAIPMTLLDAMQLRGIEEQSDEAIMQVPLGVIDLPEIQERNPLWVNLHGSPGRINGGPLLIAGAQNSGKSTALQTMLLWICARYFPAQLRCAIIDPTHDLDVFNNIPHLIRGKLPNSLEDNNMYLGGDPLMIDGSTEAQVTEFSAIIHREIATRSEQLNQRLSESTIMHLRKQGKDIPYLIVIISHYQSFIGRQAIMTELRKLISTISEARILGVYVVVTSTEVDSKHFPADIMNKFGTKIGLFLNDQQRYDIFGRLSFTPAVVPGRGLVIWKDRTINELQIALPVAGESESLRGQILQDILRLLFWN